MLSKRGVALGCLLVATTAVGSWAATSAYQLQTKIVNPGGSLTVRTQAPQTSGTVFKNFTTSAQVPVVVTAAPGYTIASVTKTGVVTTAPASPYTVNFVKSAGSVQTLAATFAVTKSAVTTSVTTAADDASGLVSPASATVDYNKSITLTATPSLSTSYVSAITVNGAPYAFTQAAGPIEINLNNVTGNKAVVVTFKNLTATAGTNQVVQDAVAAKLFGKATGTAVWSQVSGPAAGAFSVVNGATYFTPAGVGTYKLKLAATLAGTEIAVATTQVTAVADVAAYMANACNGCHNPDGGAVPSQAYANWNKSSHKVSAHGPANCVTCHTDADMPTAVHSGSPVSVVENVCVKCHAYAPGPYNYSIYTSVSMAGYKAPHGAGRMSLPGGAVVVGDNTTQYMTNGAICKDCHGHDNTINAGFAEGGHGKVSSDPMNAFNHYDWSARTNNGTRQAGNCDRCHTAAGFIKLTGQDAAVATRLAPQAGKPSNVLVCVSCHKSAEGELRTDAVVAGTKLSDGYFALFSSNTATLGAGNTKTEVAFPGYKNSSICVPCHSGRTTDKYVRDNIATITNYSTLQLANYQHAANMGQTFISKGAWDFSGKLAKMGPSGHAQLGMGSGSEQGPCVTCHYSEESKTHSLEINYASATCAACHGPNGPNLAKFEEFSTARFALDTLVRAKMAPLWVRGSTDLNVERGGYFKYGAFGPGPVSRTQAQNAYGAVYNWQLLRVWDAAAWAHNPGYARQILVDTLAFVNSNGTVFEGNATTTDAALAAAGLDAASQTKAHDWIKPEYTSVNGVCIGCHSVPQNAGAGFVQDNNGVRAITQEFSKWSHHVTGVTLQDAHCAACHLEGKAQGGQIVVDPTYHLAGASTHLRNADTDADMEWDPAQPNHSTMDNFCMSCHDGNGAISAGSAAIRALIIPAVGKTASAKNPFGDTISNRYDKMQRPGVVNVDSQFNTTNNSHHGVKGPRYSGRTRAEGARQIASPATFAQNSSAVLKGARSTMYDAGTLNQLYVPLANAAGEAAPRTGSATLGDDSTLHCGDCHTVGQWKPAVATNSKGELNTVAIGAHGSNNEYMLRNSIGSDERHTQNAYTVASGIVTETNPNGAFLVCYNCHAYTKYGSAFNSTGAGQNPGFGPHAGEYATGGRCNGTGNTIPFNGYTTGSATDGTQFESRFEGPITKYSAAATYAGEQNAEFGNVYGIQCLNCHNSGLGNAYGGIHGSANNTNTTTQTTNPAVTGGAYIDGMGNTTKVERFLPGLGNAMHVPGTLGGFTGGTTTGTPAYTTGGISNDTNWEQKHWQQTAATNFTATGAASGTLTSAGAGCYTLSESSTAATAALEGPSVTGEGGPATEGIGIWGGCDDHGAAQGKGDHGFLKRIVRPVTY